MLRPTLHDALVVAGTGMALGTAASLVVTGPLSACLVDGLSVRDPRSDGLTAVSLGLVALAASWVPAWCAAQVDPMGVLRWD